MPTTKATERMNELITSIQRALAAMEAGKLSAEGLEECTGQARSLYERLIVLRHKARETATRSTTASTDTDTAPIAAEPIAMRLDTRPLEVPPGQTSLIDAIAETETVPKTKPPKTAVIAEAKPPAPEKIADTKPPETSVTTKPATEKPITTKPVATKPAPKAATAPVASLADKMEHAPIADLHKAIALSQKFWFVAELFGGQRENYEKAIDAINSSKNVDQAKAYIDAEVIAKSPKPPGDDVIAAFKELVERRFR